MVCIVCVCFKRPVISSRLQYVDVDEDRKAVASAPRGADLKLDINSRTYDDAPPAAANSKAKAGAAGKSTAFENRTFGTGRLLFVFVELYKTKTNQRCQS